MGIVLQNEQSVGGIDDNLIAGMQFSTLTTTSKTLPGAINELNSGSSSDTMVTQTVSDTSDYVYELLFSESADNTTHTEGARKSQYFTFNPNDKALTVGTRMTEDEYQNPYTIGTYSSTFGYNCVGMGDYSHAEGYESISYGMYGHTEGYQTVTTSLACHAEGYQTQARATDWGGDHAERGSHAEGYQTFARGQGAHAEGVGTQAFGSQHVQGKYNISEINYYEDSEGETVYAHIIGNGTAANARSNAMTVDWSGNMVLAGKLTVGTAPVNNMDVATKQYVDNAISTAVTQALAASY